MEPLAEQIKQLELKLLHTDMHANPSVIDELLDSTFEEIGNDGQINTREQVIKWLLNKDNAQQWSFQDFRIKPVSNDTVIAIYHVTKQHQSEEARKGSIRSSIWRRYEDHWKMVFHQATQRV